MLYEDRDIMEIDDVIGIECKRFGSFEYNIDMAFDVCSQSSINTIGYGKYLLNH